MRTITLNKSNRAEARIAIATLINTIGSQYKLGRNLKTLTDTENGEMYGEEFCNDVHEIYFWQNGEEVIAVPSFYVAEAALVFGSRGNAYEMDYETPVSK